MTDQHTATLNPLEALAQAHEGEAFALLVEVVRDPEAKTPDRLKAAERILDQARGKPKTIEKRDPSDRKKLKAISLSMDKLLELAQGKMKQVAQADAIEAQFTEVRKRPVNPYQLPAPVVPGTKAASQAELDELLS
jgi:hypothetical protein